MDKIQIKEKENKLLELTGNFCTQKLDDDYFQLCEKLIKKLGRKREVPFKRGKIEIWAAAVVYTIGSINFLFDKSFEPYVTAQQISDYFGTKNSTVSNKARQIREMFDLTMFDNDYSTEQMNASNPFNDLVMVDGLIVSLSSIPENLQELVKKERAEGRDIEFTTERE
tara:strand:- start:1206 stop:1709 length:504 start_codon:yes stop_codon:yes gene_type:complete